MHDLCIHDNPMYHNVDETLDPEDHLRAPVVEPLLTCSNDALEMLTELLVWAMTVASCQPLAAVLLVSAAVIAAHVYSQCEPRRETNRLPLHPWVR